MIFEHEIPDGCKLYFGESAKKKRYIESVASGILYADGFDEIVTPLFSYHQHLSISDERKLVRVNDRQNHKMTLRADSTIDVVHIIDKRLGRNTSHKKWFYIQPVFRYPSTEIYQVGAEILGESSLSRVMSSAMKIFQTLELEPLVQISNMKIPTILCEMFDLTLDDFRHINIEKMLSLKVEWLSKLVYLQYVEEMDEILSLVPESIKTELIKMKELCSELTCKNTVLSPLYYATMIYYDELYFRVIEKNEVFANGGRYKNDELTSVGFAIYTDNLIETLSKEETK
jgi:histidyl-tRNA synthetase